MISKAEFISRVMTGLQNDYIIQAVEDDGEIILRTEMYAHEDGTIQDYPEYDEISFFDILEYKDV